MKVSVVEEWEMWKHLLTMLRMTYKDFNYYFRDFEIFSFSLSKLKSHIALLEKEEYDKKALVEENAKLKEKIKVTKEEIIKIKELVFGE